MLARNLLKAGYFIEPIPVGLPVTLEYDETGTCKRVWQGLEVSQYQDNAETNIALNDIYAKCISKNKVPTHVASQRGSTFVQGVLYTGKLYLENSGVLPDCIISSIIDDVCYNNSDFNIFVGNVISTAINFAGAAQIRNWLKINNFNLLPGGIISQGDPIKSVMHCLDASAFEYDLIVGYFIIRGSNCDIAFIGNTQKHISNINTYLDKCGYVRSDIQFMDGSSLSSSYYDIIKYQLNIQDSILLDSASHIISKLPLNQEMCNQGMITCPVCGKQYVISEEFSSCSDTHCLSKLYPDILHFLHRLNLEEISYDRYFEAIKLGTLTKFGDIFMLSEYQDVMLQVSFFDVLDAIIPISAVRSRETIWNFYSACNSAWDTIQYYINNPLSISHDLKIQADDLVTWLLDDYNKECIKDIILYTNVDIIENAKKFEGNPIFRGKNIYLTGKFSHGSITEIEAILRSYSAEISDYDIADCAIIGDIPENINGSKINKLKNRNVPVFIESDFFNRYEIDNDLI